MVGCEGGRWREQWQKGEEGWLVFELEAIKEWEEPM
jgi:hypothetical protein